MVLLWHLKKEVIAVVRKLILDDDTLREYMEIFDQEITRGLDKDTCEEATVKSIVTHVNKKPTGKEEGVFLGLDFSGPTIKVMLVRLENKECTITQKIYDIPEKYMTGKSARLFKFIAKCIKNFLSGIKLKMSRIPLGVTFGFPIDQTSLQDCKLLRWSKGFQCDDLINKNIFLKLKASIREYPELKKVFVIGIMNDAVSAVMACTWQDPTCMAGVVVGPGASCCYVEKVYRVTKYDAENYGITDIYMNLESAQLGEDGCLDKFRTDFDEEVDRESQNPGKIINDKLISSDYFGELVRLIVLKCLEEAIILNGQIPDQITVQNGINLEHLRRMESDPDTDHTNCRAVLEELGFQDVTDEDCFQVQFISRCVSRRSANLVAAQMAVIINRINEPQVTIAADGDLIKNYPNYVWYLSRKIQQLKNEECTFQMTIMEENFLGPALMAAVFGEEIMDRDEKFRRLPGFPMDKCHFEKKRGCMNPDCRLTSRCNATSPCDPCIVKPLKGMTTTSQDLCGPVTEKQNSNERKSPFRNSAEAENPCQKKTQRGSSALAKESAFPYPTPQTGGKKCDNPCKGYNRI